MTSLSGRDFARVIERHGWRLLRVNGSHHIYGKPGSVVRLSIPYSRQSSAQDLPAATSGKACRDRR
jgi:predicted RNA binding protein YcfA (HicA-like mRNA interferase family)